jgi:hypothetical protein
VRKWLQVGNVTTAGRLGCKRWEAVKFLGRACANVNEMSHAPTSVESTVPAEPRGHPGFDTGAFVSCNVKPQEKQRPALSAAADYLGVCGVPAPPLAPRFSDFGCSKLGFSASLRLVQEFAFCVLLHIALVNI